MLLNFNSFLVCPILYGRFLFFILYPSIIMIKKRKKSNSGMNVYGVRQVFIEMLMWINTSKAECFKNTFFLFIFSLQVWRDGKNFNQNTQNMVWRTEIHLCQFQFFDYIHFHLPIWDHTIFYRYISWLRPLVILKSIRYHCLLFHQTFRHP